MALKVTNLNGDSTFLLNFAPSEPDTAHACGVGTFSVLVDPWLNGDSTIFHRKFALAKHTTPSAINSLSELPVPNVVLISQDRTDHCHEATLKQLDPELPDTIIFAHPAAAKKIRGWKYFKASKVVAFPAYNDRKSDTVIRFRIPATNPDVEAGEATLAFIPTKFDITGVHNAIGITYRPPGSTLRSDTSVRSPVMLALPPRGDAGRSKTEASPYHCMPPTPPDSPILQCREVPSSPVLEPPEIPRGALNKLRSRSQGALRAAAAAQTNANRSVTDLSAVPSLPRLPGSAQPVSPQMHLPDSPATSMASSVRDGSGVSHRGRTISVIYSPHGASYAAIRNYASSHLIQRAGLPLTLLLHSFDRVQNAWYLGGNIISGMPGGMEIARNLLAKCWISAHDEDKESSGVAVLKTVISRYTAAEVRRLLAQPETPPWATGRSRTASVPSSRSSTTKTRPGVTDVRQMGCGEAAVMTAA